MKTISILLAAYNGEKYISEQIKSIINQTISDFELLICDDCSIDDTVKIIEEYAKNDERIKVFRNKKNIGFKKNFEKLLTIATGELIALSDQDDIWTNDHLEKLILNLGGNDLVCGNAYLADANAISTGVTLLECSNFDFLPRTQDEWFLLLLHRSIFQGAACLFRRDLLPYIQPIPETVRFHDYWIAIQAVLHGGINYIIDPILYYRQHGLNVTVNKKWNIFEKVKLAFDRRIVQKEENEQIQFLTTLKECISDESRNIFVKKALCYYLRNKSIFRWKNIYYFCKNYKYIYLSYSKKLFILRFIKKYFFWK